MRALLIALVAGTWLMAAGPAVAYLPAPTLNLLKNGGVEGGTPAANVSSYSCPPEWTCSTYATGLVYGTSTFPTSAESARIGGGNAFFAGGPGAASSTMAQSVDLSFASTEIDGSAAVAMISGCLGGWLDQDDKATIRLETFPMGAMAPSSTTSYGGPDADDRGNQTRFVRRGGAAGLPAGTRLVRITVFASRISPGSYNDGYADNLTLTLGTKAAPGATAPCSVPAGTGGGNSGGDGPRTPDAPARRATLSGLGLSATRFRAARSGPSLARRRAPVGTTVRYVLDRDATVRFTVTRRAAGVRKGSRCVRPPRRRGKGRRCTRTVTVGTFRRASKVGDGRVRFSGRVSGRRLAPGRYRLVATAGTKPASVAFRVVR